MIALKILTLVAIGVMNIFSLLLAIYGLINIQKIGDLKIFILIPLLSFFDSASLILLTQILDKKNAFFIFSEYFQIIFLNTELATIIIFYLKFILKIKFRFYYLLLILTNITFLSLRYFTGLDIANDYLPAFVIIESLIVNVFFGILFSYKIKNDGLQISQWANEINKGFFLFVNTTAPFYLIINYLGDYQKIISTYLSFIGSFGYIILFYYIYKAKKCYLLS